MHPLENHDLTIYTRDFLVELYRKMITIRLFERKATELFLANKVPGMIHTSIGQEACAVGVCMALRPTDYLLSSHRAHGHFIAKGGDIKALMAEICGKRTGVNKGRGGSMHVADPDIGMLGAIAIVGGSLPVSVGVGYSIQVRGSDQVCVVFFGEGATSQGAFHEALNFASLWNLPIVFVCENNLYAELSHISIHRKNPDVVDQRLAYGMPGEIVDGNDPLAIYQAATTAINRARVKGGPTLIECKTYRWDGHYVGDPQRYRSREEVEAWQARDPITALRSLLIKNNIVAPDTLDEIDASIQAAVDEAAQFALDSSSPEPAELLNYVYSQNP